MNLGIENKKKAITAGVLGGLALLFLIWQLSGFFSSSAPPAGRAARHQDTEPHRHPCASHFTFARTRRQGH